MERSSRAPLAVVSLLLLLAVPHAATAQLHGAGLSKACAGPLTVDPLGLGRARRGDMFTCTLGVTNVDELGDALRIDTVTDTIDHTSGAVTTPNLLPGGAPVVLPTLDDFVEVSHTGTVLPDDANPLVDHVHATGVDLGFNPPSPLDLFFTAAITIVDCVTAAECDDHDLCTIDTCENNFCIHTPGNAGTVCRSAAGICDVPETCTGTSPGCPADQLAPSTTVCRAGSGDECDLPELCPGTSADCPPDVKAPDGTPCADTDGLTCTLAQCKSGTCDQQAVDGCQAHFDCFEVKPAAFAAIPNVSLTDRFGSTSATVQRPLALCAAADQGQSPSIPTLADRLTAYKDPHGFPGAVTQQDQTIVSEFGTTMVRLMKADRLLVPSTAVLPPQVVVSSGPDHFQCYAARRKPGAHPFAPVSFQTTDPFGTVSVTLIKPVHVCVAVDKNQETPDAPTHPDVVVCYKTRFGSLFGSASVPVTNQFGTRTLELIRRIEFCARAQLSP